ncbi:MAG TPA: SDR family NAD(P)-dependent oxidoreductase, partial [Flavobacteriales bacterium]|nr:SDR family NAD(P)-dependent oxidoreductase [Flavobacteriales bacterium]
EGSVDRTVSEFVVLWALFNNTGGPPAGPFTQFDDAAWQSAFELTMLGYVRTIRAALPHLKAGGGGRIVNIASRAAYRGDSPAHWHYAASKVGQGSRRGETMTGP